MFTDYMYTTNFNDSRAKYPFGTVLVPTCEVGFHMTNNDQYRTCEGQNTYSWTSPVCHIVSCTAPQLKHGTVKDARSVSFRSELFTSYILAIFRQRNILP